jgi:ribonuclease J
MATSSNEDTRLRIIPLGGLGEIGKNMMALEYGEDIIVVDCGVQFPEDDMLGVDLVIPDISYLVERADHVRAILITHGHEDHIGALSFVLPRLQVPVYAPRLAQGLISVKLHQNRATRGTTVEIIEPGTSYQFGENFKVTWFRVCHSIPDAMGLAIETPLGVVIHTGDFKIDHTPVDGQKIDLAFLAQYGSQGVLMLLSDSTYAEVPGYTPSEQVVGRALERAVGDASGRVMVATFASLISRIQQVIDAADRHQRKVSVVGRSMVDNIKMAGEMGYLNLPPGIMVPISEMRKLPPEKVVLLTTGSQGEPTSALVRMANKEHRDVQIMEGDTVIISASPIPGNELLVDRTIDNLLRQGAKVLYSRIALVHVHGHAAQEELKLVLSLVRPRYFVPVHGEYRHLVAHAQIAWDLGVATSGIFVLQDGDVLEVSGEEAELAGRVPAEPIFIDGLSTRDSHSEVLGERRALSKDGVVVVMLTTDRETGRITQHPTAVASGFMDAAETKQVFPGLTAAVAQALEENEDSNGSPELVKQKVRETARVFLSKETGRRPMIIPMVLEV